MNQGEAALEDMIETMIFERKLLISFEFDGSN
jgi:hypothetical protein